jgi:hypothetical protein
MWLHISLMTGEQHNESTASVGPHRYLWADGLENMGVSTSHNHTDLHGLLTWIGLLQVLGIAIMHLTLTYALN